MESPGLELLFALSSSEISRPEDPLVCFIHWELVSRGLRCLGTGEQAGADDKESERLPGGWAGNKELYTLRYGSGAAKVLLKALPVDGTLIVNVMDTRTDKVSNMTVNVAEFIDAAHLRDFPRVYKKRRELKDRVKSGLLTPLLGPKVIGGKLERERPPEYTPRVPPGLPATHPNLRDDPRGSVPYGSADLNPLGGGPGGMIFDPFQPDSRPRPDPLIGLPPGSVPPGARFDPFGPPGARRPGPDNDHLPPPGYDDMFM